MMSSIGGRGRGVLVVMAVAAMAGGCTPKGGAAADKAAVAAPAGPLALPIPMVDVMRASIEIPSDGIWEAQSAEKLTDNDWLLADQDTADLAGSASLITMPGTGKDDAARLANADYQGWAKEIQKTALALRADAKAKDKTKFGTDADHLTETCQACHDKYRPATPSDGVARYPFYPKRVAAK